MAAWVVGGESLAYGLCQERNYGGQEALAHLREYHRFYLGTDPAALVVSVLTLSETTHGGGTPAPGVFLFSVKSHGYSE